MSDTHERTDVEIIYHRLDQQDAVLLQLHDMIRDHIAENRHIEGQIKELVEMYRGSKFMISAFKFLIPNAEIMNLLPRYISTSKFMISAFKFLIPIVAAVAAGVIWMREHLRI